MKPYIANLINSLALIVLGSWGYFGSETHSGTALIPVFSRFFLLFLTPWFKKGNKIIAHIAVTFTLIILIALIKPLTGSIARSNTLALIRVATMMLTSFLTLAVFVKSFINARLKA
jgi:hypothetical protein